MFAFARQEGGLVNSLRHMTAAPWKQFFGDQSPQIFEICVAWHVTVAPHYVSYLFQDEILDVRYYSRAVLVPRSAGGSAHQPPHTRRQLHFLYNMSIETVLGEIAPPRPPRLADCQHSNFTHVFKPPLPRDPSNRRSLLRDRQLGTSERRNDNGHPAELPCGPSTTRHQETSRRPHVAKPRTYIVWVLYYYTERRSDGQPRGVITSLS